MIPADTLIKDMVAYMESAHPDIRVRIYVAGALFKDIKENLRIMICGSRNKKKTYPGTIISSFDLNPRFTVCPGSSDPN